MANIISDETIEYVGILAKLELSDEEKEQAKSDMGRMLDHTASLADVCGAADIRINVDLRVSVATWMMPICFREN